MKRSAGIMPKRRFVVDEQALVLDTLSGSNRVIARVNARLCRRCMCKDQPCECEVPVLSVRLTVRVLSHPGRRWRRRAWRAYKAMLHWLRGNQIEIRHGFCLARCSVKRQHRRRYTYSGRSHRAQVRTRLKWKRLKGRKHPKGHRKAHGRSFRVRQKGNLTPSGALASFHIWVPPHRLDQVREELLRRAIREAYAR